MTMNSRDLTVVLLVILGVLVLLPVLGMTLGGFGGMMGPGMMGPGMMGPGMMGPGMMGGGGYGGWGVLRPLLVGGGAAVGDVVRRYPERAGYRVVVGSGGRRAVDEFQRLRPDLVLLDL